MSVQGAQPSQAMVVVPSSAGLPARDPKTQPKSPAGDSVQLSAALASLARSTAPKAAARGLSLTFIDKVESWIGSTWYNRLIKLPTKYMFAKDHPESYPNPRITVDSAEYAQLKKALQPGDIILCGNDDSFVHGIVYLGNGEIVHSLAQEKPGRERNLADWLFDGGAWLADHAPLPKSWREGLSMRFHALPRSTSDGIGVIHETLDSYFGRSHRDNVVVLRNPKLTQGDLGAMKRFALAQVDKPYDYGFSTFDDTRMYCTEVVVKTLNQAADAPRIKGIYGGAGPIKREMFLNEGIIASPDLQPIWKSKSYEHTPFGKQYPVTIKR